MTTTLVFEDLRGGARHVVDVGRLLVAGFTGRNADAVAEHIDELAAMGVPVPNTTPTLYPLDPSLVRQTEALVVGGTRTSGEVEPVVVVAGGEYLLTVGSDHTDRDLERHDIAASKAACTKVIGTTCIPVSDIAEWDDAEIASWIDGAVEYQRGELVSLRPLQEIVDHLETDHGVTLQDGDVLFLGTVPVQGEIRPASTFSASLRIPESSEQLRLSYRVVDVSATGQPPLHKPELEFSPVADVAWTEIEGGVDGQTERILSADPMSGIATRMLRFEPGTDTSTLGVLRHDFWEEVYIVLGDLHDLTLDTTFGPGDFACRPPGMPHGPWVSREGCVTFEVRYPAQ